MHHAFITREFRQEKGREEKANEEGKRWRERERERERGQEMKATWLREEKEKRY